MPHLNLEYSDNLGELNVDLLLSREPRPGGR
jgi:5-carboxymethyl-2-hydroxymuconate isomerase